MKTEQIPLSRRGASLEAYLWREDEKFSNAAPRQTILILPGGGYQTLSEREAEPVALAYLAEGFNAFVLRYSVGRGAVWPEPLEDAREALSLLRRNRLFRRRASGRRPVRPGGRAARRHDFVLSLPGPAPVRPDGHESPGPAGDGGRQNPAGFLVRHL